MITRENYEEFFLLYVDNELSGADRKAVETFAAVNPDLGQELEALLQCRLEPASDLVFDNPKILLMSDDQVARPAATPGQHDLSGDPAIREEYFLSYIDGELDDNGRQMVDDLVRNDPSLLKELDRLRQTVNIPDPSVVFLHKETLYRSRERVRLLWLPPALFRVAAAAVVLLIVGLLVFNRVRRIPAGNVEIAGANSVGGRKTGAYKRNKAATGKPATNSDVAGNRNKASVVTPGSPGALHSSEAGLSGRPAGDKVRKPGLTRKTTEPTPRKEVRDPAHPGTDPAELIASNRAEPGQQVASDPAGTKQTGIHSREPAHHDAAIPAHNGAASINITATDPRPVSKELSSFATQALLKDAASPEEDYDNLAMEQAPRKKNKLRGLFRRVSRVLEKTARSDDSDNRHSVLIGNLQIALK